MFISTAINDTPTIVGKAAAPLAAAECLAVKFDAAGDVVLAGAGEPAMGVSLPTTEHLVAANGDITMQIKDIGLWKTGAAVLPGAELASDAVGKCVTAAAGNFILAYALEGAAAPDTIIRVQIVKAGYKNGGVVAPLTLAGLTDVAIAQLADGDAIVYDVGTTKYVNKALALADLADIAIANLADGDSIIYELATQTYINKALGFADLADVNVAALGDGDAIVYDLGTTKYVNKALALDDLADVEIVGVADTETLTYVLADAKWKNL